MFALPGANAVGDLEVVSFPIVYRSWNGQQAACSDADYLFLVSANPLAIKPVPKLLDSSWAPYSIAFTPVGDLFFGLGFDSSDQAMARAFRFDPTHESWSACCRHVVAGHLRR